MMRVLKISKYVLLSHPYWSLLLIGIILRVLIIIVYGNHISLFGDSDSYFPLAKNILAWDMEGQDGTRTPGYPLLLALSHFQLTIVVYIQLILGLLTVLLLFSTSFRLLGATAPAFIIALISQCSLQLLFYERAIMTETLTLFCLTVSIWFLVRIRLFTKTPSYSNALLLGIVCVFTFLVRPQFVGIALVISGCYLLLKFKKEGITSIFIAFFILIPSVSAYLGWSFLNQRSGHGFTITSFYGITTAQVTTHFIEKAPQKFEPMRSVFIEKREAALRLGKDPAMSIWEVYGDYKKEQSLSVSEFSKKIHPMNTYLLHNHTWDYIKQVSANFTYFWDTQLLWNYEAFPNNAIAKILGTIWTYGQRPFIIGCKILFVLFFILDSCLLFFKGKKFTYTYFISVIVIANAIAQALVIYGNNARFSFPFWPFIVLVLVNHFFRYSHSK